MSLFMIPTATIRSIHCLFSRVIPYRSFLMHINEKYTLDILDDDFTRAWPTVLSEEDSHVIFAEPRLCQAVLGFGRDFVSSLSPATFVGQCSKWEFSQPSILRHVLSYNYTL